MRQPETPGLHQALTSNMIAVAVLKPEKACSSREKSACDCPLRSILSGDARRVALTSFEGIQSTKPEYWKLDLAVCLEPIIKFLTRRKWQGL
jgi:hypothetical protein